MNLEGVDSKTVISRVRRALDVLEVETLGSSVEHYSSTLRRRSTTESLAECTDHHGDRVGYFGGPEWAKLDLINYLLIGDTSYRGFWSLTDSINQLRGTALYFVIEGILIGDI